jgi:poly(ADP-ribose) glycohydrolase ARH3
MLGTFLADAFGRPLEGMDATDHRLSERVERRRVGSSPLGYSDDAEMMIFVAESLLECGRIDPEHLLQWMSDHHEPARGYGKGTRAAFASNSLWPEGSKGNGAAVRVAPIACLYVDDDTSLSLAAAASATVTHAHPTAIDCAVVMARATAVLLRVPDGTMPALGSFMERLRPTEPTLTSRLSTVATLVQDRASPREAIAALGNGVLAIESMPLALFCFLRWGSDFEAVVVQTALCGGDIDSIAAMSGALSGALLGEAGLPAQWLQRAENGFRGRRYVSDLANRICEMHR